MAAGTITRNTGVIEYRWLECAWYMADCAILLDATYNRHRNMGWCRVIDLTCRINTVMAEVTTITDDRR